MNRKWIKYIIRIVVACVGLWIIALWVVFLYITANKEKIIASIKANIDQKVSAKMTFGGLAVDFFKTFPGISIDLENVRILDSSIGVQKEDLLELQHLYIIFGLLDLITGNRSPEHLAFSNGKIYFFTDSSGNKNWDVLKEKPDIEKVFDVRRVDLGNITAIFQDNGKNKFYEVWFEKMKCRIYNSRDQIRFEVYNRAIVRNASFDTHMGSYLTNKRLILNWGIIYDKESKRIALRNERVKINDQSYRLSGNFFLDENPHFDLTIETTAISLKETASIFPVKIQRKINQFQLSKSLIGLRASLSGPMRYFSFPVTKIYFSVENASLGISTVRFEHCSFDFFLTNVIDSTKPFNDQNSLISLSRVRGEWEKNAFDARNISIYNLVYPYMKCDIHFVFQLEQLEKAIASRSIDFNRGDGEATLNYMGPLTKKDTIYSLDGMITVHNGDMTYNPRNLEFKKTDMELYFQNGDMVVKRMNTEINNNKISTRGRLKGFLNFFNTDASKADFEWNIYSPHLDIGSLRASLHRKSSALKKRGYSFFERLNDKIDQLFDDCNAYLSLRADKLVYKNFSATNVNGKLTLKNDRIALDDFSLLHAGGSIIVNASSKDNANNSDVVVQSKMQNVNVKELFEAFNNFGMESLTSENIDGTFSADILLTSMLDANYNLYKPASRGYINFSLKNGKLEDFKPLMDIDNHFLQKRDLSNISFAELKDQFDIQGNDIKINRMEIKSTAINMYVEGIYSFVTNTDLSIQIPLLGQKNDSGEIPGKKGNQSKGGISIFLRARDDKDGKLKIGYDFLGRFRNKK